MSSPKWGRRLSSLQGRFLAAVFLDYQVAEAPFDHGLDLGLLVSGDDEEPERVLPHRFEGGMVDLDRDHAARLRALAKERQQLTLVVNTLFEVCDVDVDLAEERFVADGPLFPRRHESFDAMPACRGFLVIGAGRPYRVRDVLFEEEDSQCVGLLQVEGNPTTDYVRASNSAFFTSNSSAVTTPLSRSSPSFRI